MATAAEEKRPRIVVLPFAQQGHINPLMQLAKTLANRGAEVTFVVSENTVPEAGGKGTPNLKFVGVPDNLPPERSRGSNLRDSVDSMVNMEASFGHFLGQVRHQVSAVIYDAFMTWVPPIASSLSIPCICFFTTNATAGSLVYQTPSLVQRGVLPFRQDGEDDTRPLPTHKVQGIEGVPDLLPEEFPLCLTFDSTHFRYRFLMKIGETLHEASAIVLNTMEELEPEPLAALEAHKPVFTVGPLLLLSGRPSRLDVNYWPEEDHCLPWLDTKAPSSVLFVSFGSVASLSLPHFQELARGLEASGQPFLWVVRADAIEVPLEEALPDGFGDRTKDRGLIISWGPQLLILSHPAIGGFFTHGGWNSIIENISTGSVPMICWPHVAEQRLNRRLVTEFWKIGVGLHHREDGSVAQEVIARAVGDLFHGERGKVLREAAKKVGVMAKKATAEGGSSCEKFESLYQLLSSHCT